jgi:FdhD protein
VSGRISFEIVQKAVAAGIGFVAGVSAPSSLGLSLAEKAGVTIAGFLRGGRANIYTHPSRLDPEPR